MTRVLLFVLGLLAALPARADDPPEKLTPEQRKQLLEEWKEAGASAQKHFEAKEYKEARADREKALGIAKRLYPASEFPDGHANLAASLNFLGIVARAQKKYDDAEKFYKESLEMRKRLYKEDHTSVAQSLHNLGILYRVQEKYADAEAVLREAVAMRKRLPKEEAGNLASSLDSLAFVLKAQRKYAAAEPAYKELVEMRRQQYKGDHLDLATHLTDYASVLEARRKYAEAEALLREALAMRKRLTKGDAEAVAAGLDELAYVLKARYKYADAEPLYKEALEMNRRLHPGDHAAVAASLDHLAYLYETRDRYAAAEPLYKEALDIRRRLYKKDNAALATSLDDVAFILKVQRKYAEAETYCKEALGVWKRLARGRGDVDVFDGLYRLSFLCHVQGREAESEALLREAVDVGRLLAKGGDHPSLAEAIADVAKSCFDQGKYAAAESLGKEALEMRRRLYKGDRYEVAESLRFLVHVYAAREKYADADPLSREAMGMGRRLIAADAWKKSEGEALNLLLSHPLGRDLFLSNALKADSDPAAVYAELLAWKGFVARISERRLELARAASGSPQAARLLTDLADARQQRADILLEPEPKTLDERLRREAALTEIDNAVAKLTAQLPKLPALAPQGLQAVATPAELRAALPADVAVVDYVRHTNFDYDPARPGIAGEKRTRRYTAFVVTRDKVTWLYLGTAAKINPAVSAWREAITGGADDHAAAGSQVRALLWEKVRKELPEGIKTVYVCPDAGLWLVPWAALPGDKPGTILLEDFAVATIPHAPFLLDKLAARDKPAGKDARAEVLVAGGVKYDATIKSTPAGSRGDPLVKPGAKLAWSFLPGSVGEAAGVADSATKAKFTVRSLGAEEATTPAVLAALPKVRYAHLATHGFFADPTFRSLFELDEWEFDKSKRGDRLGRVVNNPLLMTGLVFAGANNPKTPGRGILTGESIVDLDLSGLRLAVLSACETGVGDFTGSEGSYGLQRAFHYAGTRDVVASLWKVPDEPTAALMALFYRNLWEKNLSPMESLRQAQLEVYRNPGKVGELAKGFRGTFDEVPGAGGVAPKPGKDGKAHPILWAGFSLSGPGW